MVTAINIVVPCTKRKSRLATSDLQLRTIRSSTLQEKHRIWVQRLRRASADVLRARELYAGDHWSVVRSLVEAAGKSGFAANVWVCSAGYGLIPLDAKVRPYAATFASGFPDSVTRGIRDRSSDQAAKDWWTFLAKWQGPVPRAPRSIAVLARRYPDCPLLVAASPTYINAIEEDVASAAKAVADAGNLMIFSGNPRKDSRIASHYVPCPAVLQHAVGGARTSLNVRVLREVLERTGPGALNHLAVRRLLERLIKQQPKPRRTQRRTVTDSVVERYIAQRLKAEGGSSFGALLRKFRDEGYACEYSRFRALFRDVQRRGSHGK